MLNIVDKESIINTSRFLNKQINELTLKKEEEDLYWDQE